MILKFLRNEDGYSMVEVVAAMMILSLAIIPMVGMFDAGLRASVVGSNYDKGRALANERLEEVRALPYNKPGGAADSAVEIYRPGSPVTGTEGIFNYTITTKFWVESGGNLQAVSDNSITRPMMQATVTVTWGPGKSYTTTGFTAAGTG